MQGRKKLSRKRAIQIIMKEYSNKEIKVLWNPEKCIQEIMKVVDRCPSGALTYEKMQSKDEKNVNEPCAKIKVMKNGPLLVEGGCSSMDQEGKELASQGPYALCRCGGSGKKPFCDGTHIRIGFDDTK
jgi:hypothetical protein